MKNYAKSSTHKGRVAYRTPSRWLAGQPEAFKRRNQGKGIKQNLNFRNNPFGK